ncbi:titin isoform X4 [Solea solea]|uniref:titin isoform X4 n=1 Tax=Solea solea TaxID=90069 RepID=UPI00272C2DA2|nr:titin isoform X4 [Solea solea]
MGTQGTGRKRSTKKDKSTAEDDALNLIAREAEARLAAKRAARAEAREIRMKELERQQKEIFQVQKKYYGLNTKLDDRVDNRWGDIEQWMEDSERYSRSSQIHMLSDDDERMSVGSRGSVRSDLDAVGAYGGGGASHKKSKKKKKHKHKDKDRNGYDDNYSVISSRSSLLTDDSRASRASRSDLQPTSFTSSDLYNGLSTSRNHGSTYNGYQNYEDSLCSGSRRLTGSSSHPLEYTSYRSSGSRASSRASSARASPVDNCSSVASFLRSTASSSGLTRDLDDVTIPDFPDVEDRDYLEKGSRTASSLTAATLTSLGGTSSRRGSGETALAVDAETSIREIKEIHELKDQIQDVETKYTQNLKEAKDRLTEMEEKYRKAMVSNAQLDNEKNNLMYQVDTLKDSLMELEELLSESRRQYEEKVKEFDREKHTHGVLQFQFNEMKETLKQSEELLNEIHQLRMKQEGFVREISDLQETVEWKDKKIGALERQKEYSDAIRTERDELREEVVTLKDILKKHGIVLGPDLNINGDNGEAEVDGPPSGDSACQPAQDSQISPTEGNSVLGNTEETLLRSCGDEEVDPEQHQEIQKEGAKENQSNSDTLFNVDVSTMEASREEKPTEEQTRSPTVEDSSDESGHNKDLNNDHPITEAKSKVIYIPEIKDIVKSAEENIVDGETPEGGKLETRKPDLVETETKSSGVDTNDDNFGQTCNEQEDKPEDANESTMTNTESCPRQTVVKDSLMDSLLHETISAESNTAPHESENAEEAEDDEADVPSKSQGATAAGKKKKRKRRGKKKVNIQRDGTDKEIDKTQVLKSAEGDNGSTPDPNADSVMENVKESKIEQVENEQDEQKTDEVGAAKAVESNETLCLTDSFKDLRKDHVTRGHDEDQTEAVKEIIVAQCDMVSCMETHKELITEPTKDEQDEEQSLETYKTGKVECITTPPEAPVSTSDRTNTSNRTERTGVLDEKCTDSVDNAVMVSNSDSESIDLAENTASSVDGIIPESTANEQEYSPENKGKETPGAESHGPGNSDVAADLSESTNDPERQHFPPVLPPNADDLTDHLEVGPLSEPLSDPKTLSDDTPILVLDKDPEEATETIKNEEQYGIESEQEDFSSTVDSVSHNSDNSELKPDETQKEELNRDLREPEDAAVSDSSFHDEKGVSCDSASLTKNPDAFDTEKCLLKTEGQNENAVAVDSQILDGKEQAADNPDAFDTENSLLQTEGQDVSVDAGDSQILEGEEQGAENPDVFDTEKSLLQTEGQDVSVDAGDSQILEGEEQGAKNPDVFDTEKSLLQTEGQDVSVDAGDSQILEGEEQGADNPDVFDTEKSLSQTEGQNENAVAVDSQILDGKEQAADNPDAFDTENSLLKIESQDVSVDAGDGQILEGEEQEADNPDVFDTEKSLLQTEGQNENAVAVDSQILDGKEQAADNPDAFDTEKSLLKIEGQDVSVDAGDSQILEGEEQAADNPDAFDTEKSLLKIEGQDVSVDAGDSQILEGEEQGAKNPDVFDTEKSLLQTEGQDVSVDAGESQILEGEEQVAKNPDTFDTEKSLLEAEGQNVSVEAGDNQILEGEEQGAENPAAFDNEKSPLKTEGQDEKNGQVSEGDEKADESNSVSAVETDEINSTDVLSTPDTPEEAAELGSCLEQNPSTGDKGVAEDPNYKMGPNDQESETGLCPVTEQLHEFSKDECKDDSSQPIQQGNEDEDEEGQSFDFDDIDIEAAVEKSISENQEEDMVEEGVEAMSDGSSNGCPELCQSKSKTNESTKSEETGGNNEKSKVDECNQVYSLNTESDTTPQDTQNSLTHEGATSDGDRHMIKEETVLNVGKLDIVENINQATSLPVEEGVDAIKHEMQGDDVVLPKSADQVVSKKDPQHSGKDMKKNSKKGKGKSKEDCKMS